MRVCVIFAEHEPTNKANLKLWHYLATPRGELGELPTCRQFLLWLPVLSLHAEMISATEASRHVGQHATVCGEVAGEHTASNSWGTPTFINLDKPYPNQVFTILIWGENRDAVGHIPQSGKLCVTGPITEYRGIPEVVLRDSHGWYVPK